ncbi:UNVERIFIED_CONTAM: Photosystem I chlorophyll a apoprotein A2 [Sesamum calycinum]|uniref:Photosystem I chlorophyll a apoprotein A2 n=1 Tax=Sesamum calycinum TaxID=2727403 RepID=A0AAW2JHD0_9LAMI
MQSDVWGSISDQGVVTHITGGNFAQSSITINGWLRDFLWAQASQVIQSYGSSLSAYGLFFLAWQGNFESWVQDPLHVRPIAHAIWDPHFGKPAVEAFTRGGALGPVNIAYSGVYQWWLATLTTEMETERFVVQKCRISSESSFVRTLRRKFLGLDRTFSTCGYSWIQRGMFDGIIS